MVPLPDGCSSLAEWSMTKMLMDKCHRRSRPEEGHGTCGCSTPIRMGGQSVALPGWAPAAQLSRTGRTFAEAFLGVAETSPFPLDLGKRSREIQELEGCLAGS